MHCDRTRGGPAQADYDPRPARPSSRTADRAAQRHASAEGRTLSRGDARSLAERGLVEKETDPADRRAHRLRLSTAGEQALSDERARRVTLVTDALAGWTEADKAELARLLGQLSDTLEARWDPTA